MMSRFVLLITPLIATNQIIPTEFDSFSGDVLVSTSVVGVGGHDRDPMTVLTLARSSLIATGDTCCPSERVFVIANRFRIEDPYLVFAPTTLGRPQIGMGPDSAILDSHGPIGLFKNLTNPVGLVLNTTEEFFNDFCDPTSITTFWYSTSRVNGIAMVGSLGFGSLIATPLERIYMKTVSDGSLLGVPFDIHSSIMDALAHAGAVRMMGNNYTNCENIPHSLSLTISIRNPNDYTNSSLTILPEDYLRKIPGTDTCRLLISTSYRRVILLNPLMLPGVNIRLGRRSSRDSGGYIQLCDTSI